MSRWSGKYALVTGASAGIGSAICHAFTQQGIHVIGCARNITPINELAERCKADNHGGKLIPYRCDVSVDHEIDGLFKWIEQSFGCVHVCVNNAGFSYNKSLLEITGSEMRAMLDVNVVGLTLCASHAVRAMKANAVHGHVFNINSMSGHRLTSTNFNFYAATKFAVTALTEGLRTELVDDTKIRVTSISPGFVETEFMARVYDEKTAQDFYASHESLQPEQIADLVLYTLNAPPVVQIHDVLMRPVGQKL